MAEGYNDGCGRCIFCDILAGNAAGHVIAKTDGAASIVSLEGHPLVLPRAHVASLADLDGPGAAALMRLAVIVARALQAETGCKATNLILSDGMAAGQDVLYVHLHVKPRWPGHGVVLDRDTMTRPAEERMRLAAALTERLMEP